MTRQYLFLQGLAGPFFARLGKSLLEAGHGVHRINFHGGDRLFWPHPGAIDYRGTLSRWPAFLEAIVEARGITDLVLFGDCRPLHRAAISHTKHRGILVHVFEEGYIRPDWVTLEDGGVNGLSSLPRDPGHYLDVAATLPASPQGMPPVPSSFRRRALEDIAYNVAAMAAIPLYPGYRSHRPLPAVVEYAGWLLRFMRGPGARRRSAAVLAELSAHARPYFVFPLQLDCDYQIRVHSRFSGMEAAIRQVLASFAANATLADLLVVKAHPLDNGLRNWRRLVHDIAHQVGISDRLLFLDQGDIDSLVRSAKGVVTVNSTTGTLALAHGVPVATLGLAVYDIPRVTHQGGLDRFWTDPDPHEPAVFEAVRRVLVKRCLIRGGFFSEAGLTMLVQAATDRLTRSEPAMIAIATASRATGAEDDYGPARAAPARAG